MPKGTFRGMTVEPEVPEEFACPCKGLHGHGNHFPLSFSGEGWDRKSVIDTENKNMWDDERRMTELSARILPTAISAFQGRKRLWLTP